jgi:hypothetical protein
MSRWLFDDCNAIQAAKDYRASICPDPEYIDDWYRRDFDLA